jgi:hypothetical protein
MGLSRSALQQLQIALILPILLTACGPERHARSTTDTASARIPDSLVARGTQGSEIWFTLARVSHRADGTSCVERGLEIRRGNRRIPVPLLYTGAAPTFVDESTLHAELWNQCQPAATYRVSLLTGRPVRVHSGKPGE